MIAISHHDIWSFKFGMIKYYHKYWRRRGTHAKIQPTNMDSLMTKNKSCFEGHISHFNRWIGLNFGYVFVILVFYLLTGAISKMCAKSWDMHHCLHLYQLNNNNYRMQTIKLGLSAWGVTFNCTIGFGSILDMLLRGKFCMI